MKKMYFVANWVNERKGIKEIGNLFDYAADLNSLLWFESFTTEDGFHGTKFIIRVTSEVKLKQFKERTSKELKLSDWQPIEIDEEAHIVSARKIIRFSELSGNLKTTLISSFIETAYFDERIAVGELPKLRR